MMKSHRLLTGLAVALLLVASRAEAIGSESVSVTSADIVVFPKVLFDSTAGCDTNCTACPPGCGFAPYCGGELPPCCPEGCSQTGCTPCPIPNPDPDGDGVLNNGNNPCEPNPLCSNNTLGADGNLLPDCTDNCPFVSNSDQADSDCDGIGDVCDDKPSEPDPLQSQGGGYATSSVKITTVPIGSSVIAQAQTNGEQLQTATADLLDGTIVVNGVLDTTDVGGAVGLSDSVARDGFYVSVKGAGLKAPVVLHFPPCPSVLVCDATDQTGGFTNQVSKKKPNRFGVRVRARKKLEGPLTSEPVTVTLSVGGFDRPSQTATCTLHGSKRKTLICKH